MSKDMEPIDNWKNDALNDESFFSIFSKSIFVVGSHFDNFIFAICVLFGSLACIFARLFFGQLVLTSKMMTMCHDIAAYGAGISVAVLGFLISGFSIFSTMMKPEYFHVLAKFKSSGREISEFKFVMYNYLYIFGHYIIYLLLSFFMFISFVNGTPVWYIGKIISNEFKFIVDIFLSCSLVVLSSYTFFIILLLRGFIWNLYQGVLFAIFYKAEG